MRHSHHFLRADFNHALRDDVHVHPVFADTDDNLIAETHLGDHRVAERADESVRDVVKNRIVLDHLRSRHGGNFATQSLRQVTQKTLLVGTFQNLELELVVALHAVLQIVRQLSVPKPMVDFLDILSVVLAFCTDGAHHVEDRADDVREKHDTGQGDDHAQQALELRLGPEIRRETTHVAETPAEDTEVVVQEVTEGMERLAVPVADVVALGPLEERSFGEILEARKRPPRASAEVTEEPEREYLPQKHADVRLRLGDIEVFQSKQSKHAPDTEGAQVFAYTQNDEFPRNRRHDVEPKVRGMEVHFGNRGVVGDELGDGALFRHGSDQVHKDIQDERDVHNPVDDHHVREFRHVEGNERRQEDAGEHGEERNDHVAGVRHPIIGIKEEVGTALVLLLSLNRLPWVDTVTCIDPLCWHAPEVRPWRMAAILVPLMSPN